MEEEDVKYHLDLCYCMKKSYLGQIQCVDTQEFLLPVDKSFGDEVDGFSSLGRGQLLEPPGSGPGVLGHDFHRGSLVVSTGEERADLKGKSNNGKLFEGFPGTE